MTERRGVIFDLDGTLRDSRKAINVAVRYALQQHLAVMPPWESVMPHVHGMTAVHEHIAPHIPLRELVASYDEKYASLRHTVTVYADAAAVLERLHTSWRLGVASTSRTVDPWLEATGLARYFDATVGGLDVINRKPHPEPVLLVLARLQVEPSNAVMVGDVAADILAGKAAGTRTIGVTHGFGLREALAEAGADYIVDSLPEMLQVIESL